MDAPEIDINFFIFRHTDTHILVEYKLILHSVLHQAKYQFHLFNVFVCTEMRLYTMYSKSPNTCYNNYVISWTCTPHPDPSEHFLYLRLYNSSWCLQIILVVKWIDVKYTETLLARWRFCEGEYKVTKTFYQNSELR